MCSRPHRLMPWARDQTGREKLHMASADAAWLAFKRSRYRAVIVRLTLALVVLSEAGFHLLMGGLQLFDQI